MPVVILDIGKKNTKAILMKDREPVDAIIFPSLTEEILFVKGQELSSEKAWIVKDGNRIFKVGECCNSSPNSDSTKMNDHTRIILNTVLHKFLDNCDDVEIHVGSQTNDTIKDDYNEQFSTFLKQSGRISIEAKDYENNSFTNKTIFIKNITVWPEGMAFVTRYMQRLFKELIVVDIGGENSNIRHYDNKGNTLRSFSLNQAGMNTLTADIKSSLYKCVTDNTNIESIDIINSVRTGVLDVPVSRPNILEYHISKFIKDDIVEAIQRNRVNIKHRGIPVLFTGGGSNDLKAYLERYISNDNVFFSKYPLWDNVLSFAAKYLIESSSPAELPEKLKGLTCLIEGVM